MAVTTASGIMATESFFKNSGTAAAGKLTEKINNNNSDPFILGSKSGKDTIAGDQFFSSQIKTFDPLGGDKFRASFEIKSGVKPKGRNLKTARAFYSGDNIRITGENEFPGNNAFSALGKAEMAFGNAGMKIFGHATFENGFKTQNGRPVEFLPDPNDVTKGSVYIKGKAEILNDVHFGVNTFFEDSVQLSGVTSPSNIFHKSVGFNANVTGNQKEIGVLGDVWINGDFRLNGSKSTIILKANGVGQTINYTEKLSLLDPAPPSSSGCCPSFKQEWVAMQFKLIVDFPTNCNGSYTTVNISEVPQVGYTPAYTTATVLYTPSTGKCKWQTIINSNANMGIPSMPGMPWVGGSTCNWNSCQTHGITKDAHIENNQLKSFNEVEYDPALPVGVTQNDPVAVKAAIGSDILKKLDDMKPLAQRGEPDLNMKNIEDNERKFLDISKDNVLDAGGNLTGGKLQAFYDMTYGNSQYDKYYDNGHLLIRIPEGTSVPCGDGVFNGKVIFNVEGTLNPNARFYSSDPNNTNASTLIYVGNTGKLTQFGVGKDGNFSGLIYVDPNNADKYTGELIEHTFSWGDNTTIKGAVILKSGRLTWNSNSSTTEIHRDKNVLKNYGFLLDNPDLENKQVEVFDHTKGLNLRAAGYYFY